MPTPPAIAGRDAPAACASMVRLPSSTLPRRRQWSKQHPTAAERPWRPCSGSDPGPSPIRVCSSFRYPIRPSERTIYRGATQRDPAPWTRSRGTADVVARAAWRYRCRGDCRGSTGRRFEGCRHEVALQKPRRASLARPVLRSMETSRADLSESRITRYSGPVYSRNTGAGVMLCARHDARTGLRCRRHDAAETGGAAAATV